METTQLEVHLADQERQLKFFSSFFWHRFRSDTVLRYLKKYEAIESVLDIGAGAGVFGLHINEAYPNTKYSFVEPIPSLNEALQTRYGAGAAVDPAGPFSQRAFVMLDVLEHIENDFEFLKDLNAKMPHASLLIITCPANKSLWSKWDEQMGHFRRYSRETLSDVCKRAGFEVLESKYIFHAFILPAYLRTKKEAVGPEFPQLSSSLNKLVYWFCRFESLISKWIPFGTSTVIVARKT